MKGRRDGYEVIAVPAKLDVGGDFRQTDIGAKLCRGQVPWTRSNLSPRPGPRIVVKTSFSHGLIVAQIAKARMPQSDVVSSLTASANHVVSELPGAGLLTVKNDNTK